jgi:hypothetical protein
MAEKFIGRMHASLALGDLIPCRLMMHVGVPDGGFLASSARDPEACVSTDDGAVAGSGACAQAGPANRSKASHAIMSPCLDRSPSPSLYKPRIT